jgi:hypothetical protein
MAISKYCQGRMHMREFYGDWFIPLFL